MKLFHSFLSALGLLGSAPMQGSAVALSKQDPPHLKPEPGRYFKGRFRGGPGSGRRGGLGGSKSRSRRWGIGRG